MPEPSSKKLHVAIITSGGAGMFCGACMHDNTWTRAMINQGAEATLIPTYTPIRVDEQNMTGSPVFLGGINVYLNYRSRLWRRLPRFMKHWLNTPWIINLATSFGVSNDAHELGALTVTLLEGEQGPELMEIEELAQFVGDQLKPDVVCLSNALLSGTIKTIKQHFQGPVYCVLQGDDVFLEELGEPYRGRSLELIRQNVQQLDGVLVHSDYYRDFMSKYLDLPVDHFQKMLLGIDLKGHDGTPNESQHEPFTIGFFARICKEKGLHNVVQAFELFHKKYPDSRLCVGGFLGKESEAYFQETTQPLAALNEAYQYWGSPDTREEKVAFYKSLSVLSVPTDYHEPKGLFVLEAMANGVPVVQPAHGAFPELIEKTEGGLLVPPGDPQALADAWEKLYQDKDYRRKLAQQGYERVRQFYSAELMAEESLQFFQQVVENSGFAQNEPQLTPEP
ncbi:D-inositol 3-phosphate glycosyltransferase [Gimesia alba]|uniref:D-inositol 3-phosphate glycosyltransferase n=1 Tax=Gimesia alba TaxID=2527973 RepID=A0A517RLM0_9PLAN|nr:glycosyltransferase family 4 protein [Gimesia alba]QDT44759.1 D-inositol 3-phosphate glycosyltransferase [Gimesia alba]